MPTPITVPAVKLGVEHEWHDTVCNVTLMPRRLSVVTSVMVVGIASQY